MVFCNNKFILDICNLDAIYIFNNDIVIHENELFKLDKELYNENHSLILNTIIFSVISSTFDSIFIPRMTANIFNSVNDSEKLKSNLITLVGFWIIVNIPRH